MITNPDDISFTYHKKTNTLTASSDQPLLINNARLGYKITYFLLDFSHAPGHTFYEGSYFFAEDTSGRKPREIKQILRARDNAYFGSRMHFVRSLWANNLKKEGFGLYNKDNTPVETKAIVVMHDQERFIALKGSVFIVYNRQKSDVKFRENTSEALIAYNGYIGPNSLWSGYISTQRVKELLPFEFEPANHIVQTDNFATQAPASQKAADKGG